MTTSTGQQTTEAQRKIIDEIIGERAYQDQKWGGKPFDLRHSQQDWQAWIVEYANPSTERTFGRPFRERMIKVAALAVAAIEAEDATADPPPRSCAEWERVVSSSLDDLMENDDAPAVWRDKMAKIADEARHAVADYDAGKIVDLFPEEENANV